MDNYSETFETWNKLAKLYEEKFMDLDLYNDTYDLFCNLLPKQKAAILEIGCGPGNITKYLLSKRPDFQILGTDIAPNMIELAKQNCPTAHFEIRDSRKIEALTKKFDAIVSGFCIPYLSHSDVEKLIIDCKNLLNDKGIIYLSFVEGEEAQSGFIKGSTGDQTYFFYHNLKKLQNQLKTNHFKNQKVIRKQYKRNDTTQEIHTILIAQK